MITDLLLCHAQGNKKKWVRPIQCITQGVSYKVW